MKMKMMLCRLLVLSVALMPLFVPVAVFAESHSLKPKLGSVPLLAGNIEAMAFTEYISSLLLNELERTGSFEVTERKRLESVMDIEGVRTDSLNPDKLQKIGSRLGLDFIVSGSVSSQNNRMLLDLKVFGLQGGYREVFAGQVAVAQSDASAVLREVALRIRNAVSGRDDLAAAAKPIAVPEALEVTGSTNAIRLRWKHSDPKRVVGYMVLRSPSSAGPFSTLSTVTETSYSDENLSLNEVYHYRISAVGQGGKLSDPCPAVKGATTVAPAAPIFMNVEPLLGGAMLSWRQRPFAAGDERTTPKGIRIYRRKLSEKDFAPIGKVGDELLAYRDQGLEDGATYMYAMTAFNHAGAESEMSVHLSVNVPQLTSGLTATAGKVRRVPVRWLPHPYEGVSGYRLFRSQAKDGKYTEVADISGRQESWYLDKGLADNTVYWYRVLAYSRELGTGGYSQPVSALTRNVPPAPTRVVSADGEPRRCTIKWKSAALADDEISGYSVYRGEPGDGKMKMIAEVPADRTTYRDDSSPLKDAATYRYQIVAHNAGGAESQPSQVASCTTKPLPRAPSGVKAASGEPRKVTLSWRKNSEADIVEYVVYRKRDDGDFRKLSQVSGLVFADSELKDGASYSYRVQAVDSDGLEGLFSETFSATTKLLPKPVNGLVLKDRATRLIGWQNSAEPDVKRYHVNKKGFFGGQRIATVDGNEWRVNEPGKLELYLTAEDSDGLESEPSALLSIE